MEYLELNNFSDEAYDFLLDGDLDFEIEFEPDCEAEYAIQQPLDYVVEEIEVSEEGLEKFKTKWFHRFGREAD